MVSHLFVVLEFDVEEVLDAHLHLDRVVQVHVPSAVRRAGGPQSIAHCGSTTCIERVDEGGCLWSKGCVRGCLEGVEKSMLGGVLQGVCVERAMCARMTVRVVTCGLSYFYCKIFFKDDIVVIIL